MHLKNAITNQYRIEIRNSSPNHKHFKTKFTHTHTPKKKKTRTSNTQILRWVKLDQMGKNWGIKIKSKQIGKKKKVQHSLDTTTFASHSSNPINYRNLHHSIGKLSSMQLIANFTRSGISNTLIGSSWGRMYLAKRAIAVMMVVGAKIYIATNHNHLMSSGWLGLGGDRVWCEILKYSQVYEPYRSIVWQERGRTHRDLNECRKINPNLV